MSIRPVDFNGMIQRTDDVGMLKHQEETKPLVDQQNIQQQVTKNQEAMMRQVTDPNKNERMDNHADAKEEGKGEYYASAQKKKKDGKKQEDGRVINKAMSGGFDMKV